MTKKTEVLSHQIKVLEKQRQSEKLAAIANHTQMSEYKIYVLSYNYFSEISVLQYENRKLQAQIAELNVFYFYFKV